MIADQTSLPLNDAPAAPLAPSDPTVLLRQQLEQADLESVGDLLADALVRLDALAREAAPHQAVANLCRQVIFERLEREQRERVNHPDLDIFIDTKKENVVDEAGLRAFLDAKVDGRPIPADELDKAVRIERIPEELVLKHNLTHLKAIVKKYGLGDLYQKAVTVVETRKLKVSPKKT